ncbi:hypothetical protein [Thioalkalivibrio sulfidiphilus]|uniref:hypothetical protein n=1 Tax=Thioalkalivibrio sulfidiphilus TaxID=1033854 RepID=UPI00036296D2|nr:hypothetical protein [Thioalkalivibrio sulfidiphilus]
MHVKAHLISRGPVNEQQQLQLRGVVEGLSSQPDHVLVYEHEGKEGGLIAEFGVVDEPQALLLERLSRALFTAISGVEDVVIAFHE